MTVFSASWPAVAQALACALASLANSLTAGRSCAAFDNSATKYPDIALEVKVKTGASAPTGEKGCYIWVYASMDGTNYSGSSAEAVGTDVAVTLDSPTNLFGPFFLSCPAAATTYRLQIPSLLTLLGFTPQKGGVVVNNQTGNALDGTAGNHAVTWSAGQPTSA